MKNLTAAPPWARSLLTLSMGWWLCTAYETLNESGTQEELVVRRLVVVDDQDRTRIVIGQDAEDTQRRSRHVGITLHDPDGAERMGLGLMDDGSVGIGLDAPQGVGAPMRDRLGLRVSADGRASVLMINNATEVPLRMMVDEAGAAHLEFLGDFDLDANQVTVRSLGIDRDETQEQPIH